MALSRHVSHPPLPTTWSKPSSTYPFWCALLDCFHFPPMYPEAYEPAFSLTIYLEWNWRFKMEYVSLQQNIQELFKLIASYKKNPVLGTFDIFDVMFSYLVDIEWYFTVFFFWSIVDLQCCVNFCCMAKWFSYALMYILLKNYSVPLWSITWYWMRFPELYSRTLLSVHSYLRVCICSSQTPTPFVPSHKPVLCVYISLYF